MGWGARPWSRRKTSPASLATTSDTNEEQEFDDDARLVMALLSQFPYDTNHLLQCTWTAPQRAPLGAKPSCDLELIWCSSSQDSLLLGGRVAFTSVIICAFAACRGGPNAVARPSVASASGTKVDIADDVGPRANGCHQPCAPRRAFVALVALARAKQHVALLSVNSKFITPF